MKPIMIERNKVAQAKNRLRIHLIKLRNEKWIMPLRLVDEKVYYSKEVFPFLKQYGIVNEFGLLIEGATVDVEKIIEMLPDFKKKPVKQISPRRAKAIGSKMVKRTLQDAIDQNMTSNMHIQGNSMKSYNKDKTGSYMDRAAFDDNELVFDYKPQKITLTDEQLFDELKARGWIIPDKLTKKTRV